MGLIIPYTHDEERPSCVLLSKSAVAGAQSMLIFLMARTPGGQIIKSDAAAYGLIDLRPSNMALWLRRIEKLEEMIDRAMEGESGSRLDRDYPSLGEGRSSGEIRIGELVGWLFNTEEEGRRSKS